ncbi:MAG: hypothetical protein Q9212_001190 [Teloschistes hypoglaucus]
MSDSNSSTAKSYLDSAMAQGQSALGSMTGSTGDKAEAAVRKDQAAAEKENSHTIGKAGPLNFSPSGGVSTDDPNRSEGNKKITPDSPSDLLPASKIVKTVILTSIPSQDPGTKPSAPPKNP